MRASSFLSLLLLAALAATSSYAQSTPYVPPNNDNPPYVPPPATPKPHVSAVQQPVQGASSDDQIDPAKAAEYQKRFEQGYALEQQGHLKEAREIYDGILADEPRAKRSLLEAGKISFKLNELAKANEYLEKLHAIVPDFPTAIELLIQINQALKRDVKVELLLREFRDLHDGGKIPQLSQSLCFVRERFQVGQQDVVVSQFFDFMKDPGTVWMAEVSDPDGQLKRRILLNYDAEATKALRAKDAKYASTEVFTWFEHKIVDGKVKQIDAYVQIFALPDYPKFRSAMLAILTDPPMPIYSAPVDEAQH